MLNLRFEENRLKLLQFVAVFAFLLFVSNLTIQAQITTFASFQQRNSSAQNFVFTNNTTSATFNSVAAGNRVYFLYDDSVINGLPAELTGFQNATITLTSSTTAASSLSNGNYTQPLNSTFTLAIIRDAAAAVGGGARRNLLTATVTTGTSTGDLVGSGNSATYSASEPGGQTVTFTSDFLDFTQTSARNFGLSFSSVTPVLSTGAGGFLSSFAGSGTGTFASNPPPFYDPPTSAAVNLGGRILTSDGRGIGRASVSMVDATGAKRIVTSNSFGYYNFDAVNSGQTVVVSVFNKRYTFTTRVVSVSNDLTNVDFIAQ